MNTDEAWLDAWQKFTDEHDFDEYGHEHHMVFEAGFKAGQVAALTEIEEILEVRRTVGSDPGLIAAYDAARARADELRQP